MSNALKYDSSKRAEDKLKKKKKEKKARIVPPAQTGEKWTFSRHLPRILSLSHCCQLNQLVKSTLQNALFLVGNSGHPTATKQEDTGEEKVLAGLEQESR